MRIFAVPGVGGLNWRISDMGYLWAFLEAYGMHLAENLGMRTDES